MIRAYFGAVVAAAQVAVLAQASRAGHHATACDGGSSRSGKAATLTLPGAERRAMLVPIDAIVREGDLTGVTIREAQRDELR